MQTPTLPEIAAMPFPASVAALRRFYDPYWAKFDFEDGPREVRVSVDYEITREDTFTIVVKASSLEEAEQLARAEVRNSFGGVRFNSTRIYDPLASTTPQPSLFDTLQ
jgi:hypothetical protein